MDNEQYREWLSSRWGVELDGGEVFAAIRELLDSEVDYRRLDAFDLDELAETLDLVLCFGVTNASAAELPTLRGRLSEVRESGSDIAGESSAIDLLQLRPREPKGRPLLRGVRLSARLELQDLRR